jgi:hypothetical protein
MVDASEIARSGTLNREFLADARDDLHGQQRVAAEREEIRANDR